MRLSTIFELLLILLLVAFAAYGRVIDRDEATHRVARSTTTSNDKQGDISLSTLSLKQATDSVNRYCTCNENICNCCRDFHIPVVQLKGPGCASLQYLQGDNLAVQLSFGDNILTSTIVNGKSPRPVCVPLPGGFTKFCGRIYSIQRDAKNHFKACLGLELQSATELEASLRVSCFRFGPDGLKLRPAEPLPVVEAESAEDDDDDDFFGLGSDDDDDDEDDEDEKNSVNSVSDAAGTAVSDTDEGADDDDDDDDILGLGALLDIFTGEDDTEKRPRPTTAAPLLTFTIPILTRPTTPVPLENYELTTPVNGLLVADDHEEEHVDNTQEPIKFDEEEDTEAAENNTEDTTDEELEDQSTETSNKIAYVSKPDKAPGNNVKKGVVGDKKKPTVTSTSINAIDPIEPEKPVKKPIKDEDDEEDEDDDDVDDEDDDDILDDDEDDEALDDEDDKYDEDEDEEDDDKLDDEKHEEHDDDEDDEDEKAEDLAILDDDDEEEEDAMLSALMGSREGRKMKGNSTSRHPSGSRQSRIMRL